MIVNPLNANELIGAAIDWRRGMANLGYGISLDGALSIATEGVLPLPGSTEPGPREVDPMVASDKITGNLWLGGVARPADVNNGIFVARKPPGSPVFDLSTLRWVTFNATGVPNDDKPLMAAGPDPGNPSSTMAYVVWLRTQPGCSKRWAMSSSSDLGLTWSLPASVGVPGLPCGYQGLGPVSLVLGDGRLVVIDGPGPGYYFSDRSDNRGATWKGEVRIAEGLVFNPSEDDVPGKFRLPNPAGAAVDPRNDWIYVVYSARREIGSQNLDLFVARSTTRGDGFENPVRLELDAAPGAQGPDQIMPWIAVDAFGGLNILYYDTRHMDQSLGDDHPHAVLDAYYSRVTNFGPTPSIETVRLTLASFDTSTQYEDYILDPIGNASFNQFIGDYQQITAAGCSVYPHYMSLQSGQRHYYTHRINICPTDVDQNGTVDQADYVLFFNLYPVSDPRADINRDSVVNLPDAVLFQALYANGGG